MLRAMRFAAKLGFSIDPGITAQLEDTAERLEAIPKARLFDEFLKMFLSGYAGNVWELIKDTPLVRSLFPSCNPDSNLVLAAMRNTDERIGNDLPVTPGFLVAVILWDDYASRVSEYNPEGKPALMYDLAMDTFAVQQQHIAMPRRFTMFAREVWQLQPRLEQRQPRNIDRLLSHKRFRAAFDFLMLRGREDNKLAECAKWWEKVQTLDKAGRQEMIDKLPKGQKRKRRRRGRNKPVGSHEHSGTVFGQPRFDDY